MRSVCLAVCASALFVPRISTAQVTTPTYPIGINCGASSSYVDRTVSPPTTYVADQSFGQGGLGLGYRTNEVTRLNGLVPVSVGGTAHGELYRVSRDSTVSGPPFDATPVEYSFAVPRSGDYLVTLHVRDAWGHDHIWNPVKVELEGKIQAETVRAHYPNRRFYASRYAYRTKVVDGTLDIRLLPRTIFRAIFAEVVQLCAIRVDHLAAAKPLAAPSVTAQAIYRGAVVRWQFDPDYAIAGYEVERAWRTERRIIDGRVQHGDRFVDDLCFAGLRPDEVVRYRVRKVDVYGNRSAWSPARTIRYLPQSSSSIPYYEAVAVSSWQLWVQNYYASFLVNDKSTEYLGVFRIVPPANEHFLARFRYRGTSNMIAPKKSRKLKFDSGHPFGPSDKWRANLNGEFFDKTLLHAYASFDLWEQARQPGAQTEHVNFSMVEDLAPYASPHAGVHLSVENYDDRWIERIGRAWNGLHPFHKDGKLYKAAGTASMVRLPTLTDYQLNYELEEGGDGNQHKDLIQLIETLDDSSRSGAEKMRWMAENFDLENLFTYYALTQLIGDGDATWHNYFLYRYPGDSRQDKRGKWTIIPWDKDITWRNSEIFVKLPLKFGSFKDPFTMGRARNRLVTVMVGDDTSPTLPFLQYYTETLARLQQSPIWTDALNRIAAKAQAILPEARLDPWKQGWDDNTLAEQGFREVSTFHARRDAFITANLPSLVPTDQTDVRLEELQVLNRETIRDPDRSSEHDPWVEIRNYGPVPRDLTGFSLTDDENRPRKWSFPSGTTIPALGRLIVWLDGQPSQGPLHANFEPNNDSGGRVVMYRQVGNSTTRVDRLVYARNQLADTSLGRHPQTGAWMSTAMQLPTPGYLNWPGKRLPELRIEEVMSDNVASIVDEYGRQRDWIEIYNAESVPISLGGHFLTDDVERSDRWEFPDLEIAPKTSVLVWADSRPDRARWFDASIGPNGTMVFHTDFAISKNGERLELTSKIFGDRTRRLQRLSVPRLAPDRSYGRRSTGGYVVFTSPTPGRINP